jgi:DNA gyrase/topoisomerase IV subunit A
MYFFLFVPGEEKIRLRGIYEIDKKNHQIFIKGWSPDTQFQTILDRLYSYSELTNSDFGYIDQSNNKNNTKVLIDIYRQKNKQEIFNKILKVIDKCLEANISYKIISVDFDGKVIFPSVDQMLLSSFEHWKIAQEKHYDIEVKKLQVKIQELNLIKIMRQYIPKVLSLIQRNENYEEAINYLSEKMRIDKEIITQIVEKHSIKKLLNINTDTLEEEEKLNTVKNKIINIEQVSKDAYKTLDQKLRKHQ